MIYVDNFDFQLFVGKKYDKMKIEFNGSLFRKFSSCVQSDRRDYIGSVIFSLFKLHGSAL